MAIDARAMGGSLTPIASAARNHTAQSPAIAGMPWMRHHRSGPVTGFRPHRPRIVAIQMAPLHFKLLAGAQILQLGRTRNQPYAVPPVRAREGQVAKWRYCRVCHNTSARGSAGSNVASADLRRLSDIQAGFEGSPQAAPSGRVSILLPHLAAVRGRA